MVKYYSDKTKKIYDSPKGAEQAEKEYDFELAEKEKKLEEYKKKQEDLQNSRGARAQEVEDAKCHYEDLLTRFVKDYGAYHTKITYDPFSIFDKFLRF